MPVDCDNLLAILREVDALCSPAADHCRTVRAADLRIAAGYTSDYTARLATLLLAPMPSTNIHLLAVDGSM